MSPVDGTVPYTITVGLLNKNLIDGVVYRFEVRTLVSFGTCPAFPLTTAVQVPITQSILETNSAISSSGVSVNQCRTWEARIVEVASGEIISHKVFYMDRLG